MWPVQIKYVKVMWIVIQVALHTQYGMAKKGVQLACQCFIQQALRHQWQGYHSMRSRSGEQNNSKCSLLAQVVRNSSEQATQCSHESLQIIV